MDTKGWALWITGLPGAGKTTLARALQQRLAAIGVTSAVLDSDELRPILAPAMAYSEQERGTFYLRLSKLAQLLAGDGVNVIIAATGNRRIYRDCAHNILTTFAEIWVRCPLATCRARDPKGLYADADNGQVTELPGVGAPYEPPLAPAAIVDSDRQSVDAAVETILAAIPFVRSTVWEITCV